ncbi:MAG TPA: alpha-L-fucosidase [Gemmatimonadales bacterium]
MTSRRGFVASAVLATPAARRLLPTIRVAASHDRMQWWREARFGMFLHWGLYSILAGDWHGDEHSAEWIRNNDKIPIDEYDALLTRWNPTDFDPDAWAAMAQRAGMKYVVLTTKHHEGFCLFDSAVTSFDVMHTPASRDICRELSRALRKRGLRVGWYHSIMDWHHPDYLPRRDWEVATRPADGADFSRYVQYLHASVDEILSNYGPIDVLWFDGQWEPTWTHHLAVSLYHEIRARHPDVIINNRIDGAGAPKGEELGDFGTPEQTVPAMGLPGKDWESCITMNDDWGYKASDHNWKSARQLVDILVETASKGGNLLLNVGPMANGLFPPEAVDRLDEIARWMKVHGDAIHATTASRFPATDRFRSTTTSRALHLFLTDWQPGVLPLPGLRTRPKSASLRGLSGAAARLAVVDHDGGFAVVLPPSPPPTLRPVVTLRFGGLPVVQA